jgi:predicted nucleic acid-binding protein
VIVVDTNILAALYFQHEKSLVIEQLQQADPDWMMPSIWKSELISVATAYYRKGFISLPDAIEILQGAIRIFEPSEIDPELSRVMNLMANTKCSSYDCQFAALAVQFDVPLITYDKQILTEFSTFALTPETYLAKKR